MPKSNSAHVSDIPAKIQIAMGIKKQVNDYLLAIGDVNVDMVVLFIFTVQALEIRTEGRTSDPCPRNNLHTRLYESEAIALICNLHYS